jgi:muramoyltetrapeptide carboxypeptidase
MMTSPDPLIAGDRIAIVAPAGKIPEETVLKAAEVFRNWGLKVVLGKHLFSNAFQYAANDDDRLFDLQRALDDPSIKAVFCARGGYGTIRIIDRLNFDRFRKAPKWIIGFSDITVIHAHLHVHLGTESIHGTMAAGMAGSGPVQEDLRSVLFGGPPEYNLSKHPLSRRGSSEGQLIGGNLAILAGLLGSSSDMDTNGKVLFIEEVGEHLYRIDRMMWSLSRAGKLAGLAGLIVGGMTDIPDSAEDFGKDANAIIHEHVKQYDYPVCFDFPAGHQPDNRPLIFGRNILLDVDRQCLIRFQPSGGQA